MAAQGPLSPSTTADNSSVGSFAWSNPNNAQASDNVYTTASDAVSGGFTHYLKATNFGFNIPAGATIDGILVEVEKRASSAGVNNVLDNIVRIIKSDGTLGATNKADTVTKWPTTDTYISYGGSADLWSETWASTDINDIDFGVAISANLIVDTSVTAFIDHIRITVTYTDATTTSTSSTSASTSTSVSTSSTSSSISTSTSTSLSTSTTISFTTSTSSTSISLSTSSTSNSTSISTSTSSTSSSTSTTALDISRPIVNRVVIDRVRLRATIFNKPISRIVRYR